MKLKMIIILLAGIAIAVFIWKHRDLLPNRAQAAEGTAIQQVDGGVGQQEQGSYQQEVDPMDDDSNEL
jgi:hypothetical protein